jgi:hypothetical protein
VIEAILVGLFIPFLSSIVPIMRVLNKNLNDALNYDRSRTKAIYVEILNNSKSDVLPMIAFGSLAITYGISIFYLFPLALISFNFALLLQIFFYILLGMFLGLVILAMNVQRMLEILLTYVVLCCEKKSMKKLVLNNLTAHKMRNKLTAIIYSLSIGFTIFMIVAYKLIMT